MVKSGLEKILLKFLCAGNTFPYSAWRDFKINFSRPLFTISFRSKMVLLVTDSILKVKPMYESVRRVFPLNTFLLKSRFFCVCVWNTDILSILILSILEKDDYQCHILGFCPIFCSFVDFDHIGLPGDQLGFLVDF